MALEVSPAYDSILDRLKNSLSAYKVYETEVPQGESVPTSNGIIKPYIVVGFGNPIRSARDHHIVGSRNDTSVIFCSVQVIAPVARDARLVRDKVINALVDFRPTDAGPMILEGQNQPANANNNAPPTAYSSHVWFTFRHNLTWT